MKNIGMAFAVGAICFTIHASSQTIPDVAGQAVVAPEWSLKDVDGKTVHSTNFNGKVIIVDFWATWCGPCRAEIPNFIALQKQYETQGLAVVGLSVDEDGAAVVKPFMQKLGINYPVILADEKTQERFGGIEALPMTFIIDRKGRIVKEHLGITDKDELENEIKPLLNP
jgi:thiol-disulfide isomerase/thioredoxin